MANQRWTRAHIETPAPDGREVGDAWRFDASHPAATFDLRRLAENRRFDVWREFNATDPVPFDTRLTVPDQPVGHVFIAGTPEFSTCHLSLAPNSLQRTAADIRRGATDTVLVLRIGSGCTIVEQNARTVTAHAEDLVLVFMDVPFHIVHLDARHIDGARLPASDFPEGLRDQTPILFNARIAPTAAIAAGHLRWKPRTIDELVKAAGLVRSQMVSLLSFAVARPEGRGKQDLSLLEAVGEIVDAEISNPDLSAKLLCLRLGVSRTALFDALAAGNATLGTMVRHRRLRGCMEELRQAKPGDTLTALARRWGFRDQTTFSRSFRRQTGLSPSEWTKSQRLRHIDLGEPFDY